MALSLSSSTTSSLRSLQFKSNRETTRRRRTKSKSLSVKCESSERSWKLEIGSAVIVTEAPKMIKTAASVPCLRLNTGLVKPGDVGRIMSRKPKDVWAVRLAIGTYLLDGKYFKPLDFDA